MNVLKTVCLATAVVVAAHVPGVARAETYSSRQYYSGWNKRGDDYYYRDYYYKPAPDYAGYKHHYVIYQPKKPDNLYFYNPYKKVYWGRCPAHAGGKPLYYMLAEQDRKGNLEEIPEGAFPTAAALPPIPDSKDGATLDLPPDDLPAADAFPRLGR